MKEHAAVESARGRRIGLARKRSANRDIGDEINRVPRYRDPGVIIPNLRTGDLLRELPIHVPRQCLLRPVGVVLVR